MTTAHHDRRSPRRWWKHPRDLAGIADARRRLIESRALAARLAQRRDENGFGQEIASALKIGKVH